MDAELLKEKKSAFPLTIFCVWHTFCNTLSKYAIMRQRNVRYFTKARAMKIMESPIQADLHTFLSATFALSRSRVVKNHIKATLHELNSTAYKLSA